MRAMTPELSAALAEVDRVFTGFTCRPDSVCLHCYPEDDVAALALAGAEIDGDTLVSLMHRNPESVDDHGALVRRLLPQMARGIADGSVEVSFPAHHCLARGDWREWPDSQSRTVRAFVDAWWFDRVATPGATSGTVFEVYAAMLGDLSAALASWPEHPIADAHLVDVSRSWLPDLVQDDNPLWLSDLVDDDECRTVLRDWYLETGVERLARAGASDLVTTVRALALPLGERLRRLYEPPDSAPEAGTPR